MAAPRLILAADDDGDIRELVRIVLERGGYTVETAGDGEEALSAARELRPDLLILDGWMPRLPGWEVARRLRADDATARIPVLLLTATVEEEREIRRLGVAPGGFMKKPFDSVGLLAEVARLLS